MSNDNRPATAMGMPEMPYRISIKRDPKSGTVTDEILTVGSMSAERLKSEYLAMREWFASLPTISNVSQAIEFEFDFVCPKCGNDDEKKFYDNTGDRKPNFKCRNCDTKIWVKPKTAQTQEE